MNVAHRIAYFLGFTYIDDDIVELAVLVSTPAEVLIKEISSQIDT